MGYCTAMFALFTTSPHLLISESRNAENSAGVPPIGSTPMGARRARDAGCASRLFTPSFNRSVTGFGVPLGAIRHSEVDEPRLGKPASAMVGTSGTVAERRGDITASAVTFLLAIKPEMPGTSTSDDQTSQ